MRYDLVEGNAGKGLVGCLFQLEARQLLLALGKRVPVSQTLGHLAIDPEVRLALEQGIEHLLLQKDMAAQSAHEADLLVHFEIGAHGQNDIGPIHRRRMPDILHDDEIEGLRPLVRTILIAGDLLERAVLHPHEADTALLIAVVDARLRRRRGLALRRQRP